LFAATVLVTGALVIPSLPTASAAPAAPRFVPTVVGSPSTDRGAFTELAHQFDYVRAPLRVTEKQVQRRGSVVIRDISYRAPGQDPVSAYLVEPAGRGRHPATIWLHWLGEEHADRSDFLDEAVRLAASSGLVSLLPQQQFPFAYFPIGDIRDRDAIIKQVIQIRRGLDLLVQQTSVDRHRIALVGHDYGGMYGSIVAAVDRDRLQSTVLVAIDATWGNWFVTFFLDLPEEQVVPYRALFDSLEPTTYLDHLPRGGLLFQFSGDDFYIPDAVAEQIVDGTTTPHLVRTYDTDHAMDLPAVEQDRDAFLIRTLRTR
jgi:pimeloyl-ACP methyl ester carboxylesterase